MINHILNLFVYFYLYIPFYFHLFHHALLQSMNFNYFFQDLFRATYNLLFIYKSVQKISILN